MTKRRSQELGFFCLPEELLGIFEPVLGKAGADLCVAEESAGRYHFRKARLPGDLDAIVPQLYICVLAMVGVRGSTSLVNLVQVWFPVLKNGRLRQGRIALLGSALGGSDDHNELQQEIFRVLRSELTKRFRRGVLGRNSKTGGEHFYDDLYISEGAVTSYKDGIVLTSLMGDGFVNFHVNVG